MSQSETLPTDERTALMERIIEAQKALVGIAHELRRLDDFDHAQDMSDAAMFCRAAYNDLRLGKNTREKALRKRETS